MAVTGFPRTRCLLSAFVVQRVLSQNWRLGGVFWVVVRFRHTLIRATHKSRKVRAKWRKGVIWISLQVNSPFNSSPETGRKGYPTDVPAMRKSRHHAASFPPNHHCLPACLPPSLPRIRQILLLIIEKVVGHSHCKTLSFLLH